MKRTVEIKGGAGKVLAKDRANTGRRRFEGGLDTVAHNPSRRLAG